MRLLITTFLLLVTVNLIFAAEPDVLLIENDQRWRGEIVLDRPVLVASGAVLEIAAGSRIQSTAARFGIRVEGALHANGTEQQPIVFSPLSDWVGIELVQSEAESHFSHVRFQDAATAISSTLGRFRIEHSQFIACDVAIMLHRQSQPIVASSVFADNRIAVDIEMRSQVVLQNNLFRNNETAVLASHNSSGDLVANRFIGNRLGVRIQHQFPGSIADNLFENNDQALLCDQTMATPRITNNHFVDNRQGLISFLSSRPLVKNNHFDRNLQAVVNNQLGSPFIEGNLFAGNRIAVTSERRSMPRVELNQFETNELALLCDYLSYPLVKNNNFNGNRLAVRLGEHQSAAMEQQGKTRQEMQDFLSESGRQGKMAVFENASGVVDVRGNWWGKSSLREPETSLFQDRKFSKWVVDETSGERYLRDEIKFSPWLEGPVAEAGIK